MYACMCVRMYGWMDVCTCVYTIWFTMPIQISLSAHGNEMVLAYNDYNVCGCIAYW